MAAAEISVLMGVYYQREDVSLLSRSVESILAQTAADFEFLICDDGSAKEAMTLLDQYAARDGRIRLIRPGGAYSLPKKLNACLRSANGSFIARMDDDDCSLPKRFEEQICELDRHPEIAFVGCSAALCRGTESFAQRRFPEFPTAEDFLMTQPYLHPTLMFRKEALDAVGGYCEDDYCDHCEDYDLLLRLYARGYRGMNLQQVLFHYTAPDAKGNRTMRHRWNETRTRWRRFRELGILPRAMPYVVKPVITGLLPVPILRRLKERRGVLPGEGRRGYSK